MMDTVPISPIGKDAFDRDFPGSRRLSIHHEVEWFATESGRVKGTLILDRVDLDCSWVVIMRTVFDRLDRLEGPFATFDLGVSVGQQDAAREQLYVAMRRAERGAPGSA
jgi:hypothetical protein